MSLLAGVLYAISFLVIAVMFGMVVRHAVKRFVAWREGGNEVGDWEMSAEDWPDDWPDEHGTRFVGPHPIYTRMEEEYPDVARTLMHHRERKFILRITADTGPFVEAMKRVGESFRLFTEGLRIPPPEGGE